MTSHDTLRERIQDAILEIDLGFPGAARIDMLAALAIMDDPKNYWNTNYKIIWDRSDMPEPEGVPDRAASDV